MNKDLAHHKVQVLHEREEGKSYRFNSGSVYTAQADGSYRSGKVKLTKAERKQAKRARQLDRHLSSVNLAHA